MKKISLYILLILGLTLGITMSSRAVNLSTQAVTFTNFGYVNYVAVSIKRAYYATTHGIIRFDLASQQFDDPLTLPPDFDRNIRRIWVDTFDQYLYVETEVGLYEYDLLLDSWFPILELPEINNDNVHRRNEFDFIAPFGYNYSGDGALIDAYGRSFLITDVVDDRIGTFWVGTWGYGPAIANSTSRVLEVLPFGLLQERVNALVEDEDLLFVSGAVFDDPRAGISILDRGDMSFTYVESGVDHRLPFEDINCLETNEDFIFAGTPDGVYLIDRDSRQVQYRFDMGRGLPDNNVISLCALGDSLLVGTEFGLSLLRMEGDSVRYIQPGELGSRIIYDIESIDNYIWIATDAGAYRLSSPGGSLQRFRDPESLLFGAVYDIERNGDDLWLASDDGAVQVNLKSADVQSYREILYGRGGRALAVNDDIAVLTSDNGMLFIFYNDEEPFTKEFSIEDGLPSTRVYSLLMDGDYIWVGSDKGLTRFLWNNPERVD